MDTAGRVLGLPVVSPLLELPQYIHNQNQKAATEAALQTYERNAGDQGAPAHSSPTLQRSLVYPLAQPGPQGGGLQMAANGADPVFPANFHTGQMLPRPTGNEVPQGAQIAQGPPQMVAKVGGSVTVPARPSASKLFLDNLNKIHSPESMALLQKQDPNQYRKIKAWRGIANFDQGNTAGAMADLVDAGLPATSAIAILQEQKNQKAMGQFGQTLQTLMQGSRSRGGTSPSSASVASPGQASSPPQAGPPQGVPTGMPQGTPPPSYPMAQDGMPLTKQEFMQKSFKALQTVPPAQRNAAFQQVQQMASTLPDRKEIGPFLAQKALPAFEEGLGTAKTQADVNGLISRQLQSLPVAARDPFLKSINPLLQNWQKGLATQQKESTLTGPALDLAAKQYLATGTMPSFGMQGQKQKEAVMNRAAQLQQAEGLTPDDVVFNQNEIKAGRQALGQIAKSQGMIMQYEDTAYKNADLALKAADKVDRTGAPVFNRWLMAGRSAVGGSPDVARFNAANQTFVNEYAKVMSGGYGASATSDSARQEALSMLNTAQTPEQYRAVVDQLKKEMNNRMEAMRHTRTFLEDQIRKAISGKKGGAASAKKLPAGAISGTFRGQKGYLLNGRFYAQEAQ
jgi:hypothetical protein